jgi:multiple antibiotic resistance protein
MIPEAELARFATRAFLMLFVVVDPVGIVPAFLALAGGRPGEQQRRLAAKAVVVAAGVMLAFALFGARLLHHLGISLDAFRVAGGILLFLTAVDMVLANRERETEEEEAEARAASDIAVFPLAIPFIAGPGSLASVMILAGEGRGRPNGLAVVVVAVLAVIALCYLALRVATPLRRLLRRTGVNVVTRVLGILLAALAVQYVADGVRGFLRPSP